MKHSSSQTIRAGLSLAWLTPSIGRAAAAVTVLSLLMGAVLAAVSDSGSFITGWLVASLLFFIVLSLILAAWKLAGGGRALAWIMTLALLLRLALGSLLAWGLPRFGYADNPANRTGYVYSDAYNRDTEAWDLAQSNEPLLAAFGETFASDQYGGLLSFSAFIYRYLSPDAHRPELLRILSAGAGALGAAFVLAACRRRFTSGAALAAAWIFALYPESLLLGASQMREPFLILLSAAAFWAVTAWDTRRAASSIVFAAGLLGMLFFSPRLAMAVASVCIILFLLDHGERVLSGRWRYLAWAGVAAAAIALALLTSKWLIASSEWDINTTVKESGRVADIVERLPEPVRVPFVVGYGLAQPVLPAAIGELLQPLMIDIRTLPWDGQPAPLIWRLIAFFRGLGWYLALPLLLYSLFSVWKSESPQPRRVLIWIAVALLAWMLIASARAGGDQWDNPRYRTVFLVWIAALMGWGWDRARSLRDPWLWRWVGVVGVFLAFFTEWYISRFTRLIGRPDFFVMILLIVACSGAILLGGIAWDRYKARRLPPVS